MKEGNKMEKEKYYISTAIAYTSGKPHIGNTYEIVLADAIVSSDVVSARTNAFCKDFSIPL